MIKNDIYAEYFEKYGLIKEKLTKLKEKLQGQSIHLFGATGALGLSFLSFLEINSINPKQLIIYVRKTSDFSRWVEFSSSRRIDLKVIFFVDNSLKADLSSIGGDSTVLYFLGYGQPKKFMLNPLEIFRINIEFLIEVLQKSPQYFFYASTSEIYSGLKILAREDSPTNSTPQHIRGAYIESKRSGEAILSNIPKSNTRAVSFRVALACPPFQIESDERILSDLVRMAKEKKEVSLKGGWDLVRQFQWGPLCIEKLLWAGYFGIHPLYNVSGGEPITLECLAKKIADYFGAEYIDIKTRNFDSTGAPDLVSVSSERLENEAEQKFPVEKIDDLLGVYLAL